MPISPHARALGLPVLILALALGGCASGPGGASSAARSHAPGIAAPEKPAGEDALPRWREQFPALLDLLAAEDLGSLAQAESADSPSPDLSADQRARLIALLGRFRLAPGEILVFPPIHGPDTPFPDHHPLRQLAGLRTVCARAALAAGDISTAMALVRENLAQARATLGAQEGIIPLIHASGVWQSALDGVHSLARSDRLPEPDARALLAELQNDAGLAQTALSRALRGEYHHIYRVIVQRMPQTDDPDLLLSSVASLGMAEPEPLAAGELGLGLTKHPLLDRDATLGAYEADLAPYLDAFARSSRFPRGLYARTTAVKLADYQRELGDFFTYASGDVPITWEFLARARAALEATPNPVGKLLAVYLTPAWESLYTMTLRREAQRAAACGLLAWRIHGCPAAWDELVAAGVLSSAPADPFSDGALRFELGPSPRVWSVFRNGQDDGGHPELGNAGLPADLVWIY